MATTITGMKFQSSTWHLAKQQEHSGTGSGEFLTANLGPDLWEADLETVERPHAVIREWRAQLDAVDDGAFYLGDPSAFFPASDPNGAELGSSSTVLHTVAANRKEVRIDALPSGYVISPGDLFHVDYGSPSRRALIEVVSGGTADAAGLTPLMAVRPHLRPGITTPVPLALANPEAKVKIVPGTMRVMTVSALMSRISLSVRQTLGAD